MLKYCNPMPFSILRYRHINSTLKITTDQIIQLVCDKFLITKDELKNSEHKRHFSIPRKIAVVLIIKYLPKLSLKRIGQFLNKDHSTIIYNRESAVPLLATNKEVKNKYTEIITDITLLINRDKNEDSNGR